MNLTLNDNEKILQKKLREEVEIPDIVTDKAHKAFRMIENHQVSQAKAPRDPFGWMKTTMKAAGCTAAVLGLGFIVCVTNPVMAKNLPLVGGIFAELQDKVSFFGDFADKATPLAADGSTVDNAGQGDSADQADNAGGSGDNNTAGNGSVTGETVYTKTSDGLTITLSEIYANDQAIYLTMKAESEEPFPETMMSQNDLGTETPAISLDYTKNYSFLDEAQNKLIQTGFAQPEGVFTDEHTYTCILRLDLAEDTKDNREFLEKYEGLSDEILQENGFTREDLENLDESNPEDYAVLEKFNAEISSRSGELKSHIKQITVPEDFTLQLDFTRFVGEKKDPEYWDSGYTAEELETMSDEKFQEVMNQQPAEYSQYPNEHQNYWYEGSWSFEIPVHVDTTQTVVQEINETNEDGIGLKSVVKTPYELTVYDMYEEGGNSDTFLVALDANGNKLPYNNSKGSINNFAIQDRDISTVDIYILDYTQYMDELKGEERYNNNENKPDEEKWSTLLEANAKYHKTLHF